MSRYLMFWMIGFRGRRRPLGRMREGDAPRDHRRGRRADAGQADRGQGRSRASSSSRSRRRPGSTSSTTTPRPAKSSSPRRWGRASRSSIMTRTETPTSSWSTRPPGPASRRRGRRGTGPLSERREGAFHRRHPRVGTRNVDVRDGGGGRRLRQRRRPRPLCERARRGNPLPERRRQVRGRDRQGRPEIASLRRLAHLARRSSTWRTTAIWTCIVCCYVNWLELPNRPRRRASSSPAAPRVAPTARRPLSKAGRSATLLRNDGGASSSRSCRESAGVDDPVLTETRKTPLGKSLGDGALTTWTATASSTWPMANDTVPELPSSTTSAAASSRRPGSPRAIAFDQVGLGPGGDGDRLVPTSRTTARSPWRSGISPTR